MTEVAEVRVQLGFSWWGHQCSGPGLQRQTLRLCEDQNGNPYVKGMGKHGGWHEPWRGPWERLGKELGAPILCMLIFTSDLNWIHVQDAEEAWKLLKVGRKNQSFASTHLNHNSSRRLVG